MMKAVHIWLRASFKSTAVVEEPCWYQDQHVTCIGATSRARAVFDQHVTCIGATSRARAVFDQHVTCIRGCSHQGQHLTAFFFVMQQLQRRQERLVVSIQSVLVIVLVLLLTFVSLC